MCGRYALAPSRPLTTAELEFFQGLELFAPVYNAAPSMMLPIVRMAAGRPQVSAARWGLVPFWAKDAKIGYRLINARAETVAEKPAFKYAYKWRRCLVPASGYFEWQARRGGKQPYYFTSRDGSVLAFAGLWEYWKPSEGASGGAEAGQGLLSFAIVVCEPNPLSGDIHDRMPVIIERKDWRAWLISADPAPLLRPFPEDLLMRYPVSEEVNRPENEGPQLIEPVELNA